MHQVNISFLNYYSLIHAIPKRYKENLEKADEELLPTKLKNNQMPSKGGKMHIWHLYQRNEIIPWKDLSKIEYRYI